MPFNPAEPNASIYGIIPQAYAQSLAQTTGDPTADAVNRLTLGMMARRGGGQEGYLSSIDKANQLGAETARYEADTKGATDRDVAMLGNMANFAKGGYLRGVRAGPNTQIQMDPNVIAQADANAIQAQQAENFSKLGTGANQLSEAGVTPPVEYIRGVMTPPQAPQLAPPVTKGYINPGDKASQDKAAADLISAQAARTRAANGEGRPNSEETVEENQVYDPKTGKYTTIGRTVKHKTKGHGDGSPAPATEKAVPRTIVDPKTHKVVPNPAFKG